MKGISSKVTRAIPSMGRMLCVCLLYTSDAADE